ncbi:Peptidyl-dipeptidase dcp, partial [termite gut metagenome]
MRQTGVQMKIFYIFVLLLIVNSFATMIQAQNPFFEKYNTPHQTVPFDKVKTEHYKSAITEGMRMHTAEIDAITDNPDSPTFANTIVVYEKSGKLLEHVATVFSNLHSAESNDEIQILAQELMPMLSEHHNNINLNEKLFTRIKAVYEQREKYNLTTEQTTLLNNIYDGFVRCGANLWDEDKNKYR